jgi:SpoIID/LytB domain protein
MVLLGAATLAGPQLSGTGHGALAAVTLDVPDVMRIGVLNGGSYAVRTIPLETYVGGVLAGEAARDSAPAALDTLAIAIRTYALRKLRRHEAEGFDLCDQTHCQVLRTPTDATEQAVARTSGQVLIYQGQLASVFYSASCGGRTEIPSAVWPEELDAPYMPSQPDDACEGQPVWSALLKSSDLARALQAGGYRGTLRNVRIVSHHPSGRVDRLAVDGLRPGHVTGQDLRMIVGSQLGWQLLRSTAFELDRTPEGYLFAGRGYGHGVGLCVIGSTRLAVAGQPATRILARYFPGATVGVLAHPASGRLTAAGPPAVGPVPPGARSGAPAGTRPTGAVSAAGSSVAAIPTPANDLRADLEGLVARARQDIAATLGVAVSPAIAVRLHPTPEAYQRETGLPWYTLGAFKDGDVHLAPLPLLSARGVLERIVRREITHALVDAELAHRPRWVRDGAALFYAGSGQDVSDARMPCPTDDDLANPVSAGALQLAYRSARACFARQVTSGRSWRDVR